MILFPAIDIRGGKCVRLTEGRFDRETVFAENPVEMAVRWQSEGGEFLHIVDLDGALAGKPVNFAIIKAIVSAVKVPVQVGGGIRNLNTIESLLSAGVNRVILGSVAVKQPDLVTEACRRYREKIVVGIDARNGMVAVEGWGKSGGITAVELASTMAKTGVERIIFTDISRDGTLSGVNIAASVDLARQANIKVIASGGVKDMTDICALQSAPSGIEGVIVGKALYAGTLSLPEALKTIRGEGGSPC
ncbi:1-(5-phosphoribosyl)-5-((5-phosphoribosylamino)methylideneamino)imidazole-4-carboxamide isomerase [Anaerosporomusa subterranea]|uniref:1-(5-phosphoribosyl)-5-[(5-phosphoribosylamino)methylideneamino] imidazole-4-carboxamide isomerase n=1 Tax=Anaerosporomusa subterranea TaxID=1794912 RepID=A0A154BMI8_ANASB|nr:1-(5-phosphoribosyl)-5-[(5-phosphoribosylamino)methylideneamino]imidazole-4-carboxamide isomerase [Anaerosporomusa subterranea]KYZ75194.1 1-(5-phosphoribosyl)-5-((5-phosphoribosylamino)methylideneamino)imidazole-4-carboxamide isomerase [Anaerosporomusa subterranea]